MPRLLLLLTVLLLLPSLLSAQQTGVIEGRVLDSTGAPLKRAVVRVMGTPRGAYTRSDGRFTIANVRAGSYDIQASFVGTRPVIRSIRVVAGETLRLDTAFVLRDDPVDTVVVVRRPNRVATPEQLQRPVNVIIQPGLGPRSIEIRGGRATEEKPDSTDTTVTP